MADKTLAEKEEEWRQIGGQVFSGALDVWIKSDTSKFVVNLLGDVIGALLATAYTAAAPIGIGMGRALSTSEDLIAPAFADFAAAGINDLFGTNVSAAEFMRARGRGEGGNPATALGRAMMDQMRGTTGPLAPGEAAAAKYVTARANQAIEDWFKGWFFKILTSLVPELDIGKVDNYGALGDKVAEVMGLNRISARVFRPLAEATIVTPLEWQVNKTYRPRLLSATEATRQVQRRRWTREQAIEELARQGYSDTRIEALFNAQRKFLSASDARTLVYFGSWTNQEAEQHLRDQGYDEDGAVTALRLEGLRRNAAHEDALASVLISAYANRDIEGLEFRSLIGDAITNQSERTFALELGEVRRQVNTRRITSAQTAAAVRAKILAVADYRHALEREGYPPDDVLVLELLLRAELDKDAAAAEHRAAALAERAAEKAARDAATAARLEAIERERAEQRRGPIGALEDAAIRGLIPLARVAEVYAFDYDDETVAILLERLEDRRAAYVAAEAQRAAAEQRAARRGLSIAQLRAGVVAGALTIEEFAAQLGAFGLPAPDQTVLVSTLRAQLAARAAALEQRRQAAAAAKRRRIDLGRFERLVRLGARPLTEYAALLADLGFDEGSVAAMRELLEREIANDAAARAERERKDNETPARELTVSQYQRGVVLGAKTRADYAAFLQSRNFTVDAQVVLLAELDAALEDAAAARAARAAAEARSADRALPLSRVRRAAQLSLIAPETYFSRLQEAGYGDDDIAIEAELLLAEIADVQARRAARDAAIAAQGQRGLSVAQAERAVKAGTGTLEQFRSAVAAAGYSADAGAELLELLERELAGIQEARARRGTIGDELATRSLSLSQLEDAVKQGFKTLDEYYAELLGLGYGSDDAELLTSLLATELDAADAGPS